MRTSAHLALLVLALAIGLQPARCEEPTNTPEAAPAKAAKPHPSALRVTADLAYGDWSLSGNPTKFRQYATPARGFFLEDLRLSRWSNLGIGGELAVKGLGADDLLAEGRFEAGRGATTITGSASRYRFLAPTPTVPADSNRLGQDLQVRQLLTPNFGISMFYRMDEENHRYAVPFEPLLQRARTWNLVAEGTIGQGAVSLGVVDWRYFDRTGVLPDTTVRQIHLTGSWTPSSALAIETGLQRQNILQSGRDTSHIDTVHVRGDVGITPGTDLSFQYQRDQLVFPNAANATLRQRRTAGTRLVQRFRGWTGQIGVRWYDADRLNGDQTYLEVPRWWSFDGRVYGRLGRFVRMTLAGSTQQLQHNPTAVTTDTRALMWDDRRMVQLKLDAALQGAAGYLVYTNRRNANDARAVSLTSDFITLGGSWDASPRVSTFAEVNYERWQGNSSITPLPDLDYFAPDSRTTLLGVSWVIDPRTFFTATYTDFTTSNANPLLLQDGNTRGHFLTVNLSHRFRNGSQVGLVFAPWEYRDQVVNSMNYSTSMVMVTGSARF